MFYFFFFSDDLLTKCYQIWHINLMTEAKYMFTGILIQIDFIKSLEIIIIIKKGFQQLLVTIYACTKLLLQEMKC